MIRMLLCNRKGSFAALLAVALALGPTTSFAITWFSEEERLDALYNDIRSLAPDLGTLTEFGYMGSPWVTIAVSGFSSLSL